jgi:hypothetical protein
VTDDLDQTTISPQETYEPSADAAPAVAVLGPGSGARGSRRWGIAVVVVGLLVVASALAVGLLTGRAASATVLGYVPSDSIMYGEVRLDLPGDQRAAVASFMSKFPGFADQAAIETKVDEVLDRLVADASAGEESYSADIKPWFGGEVAFSFGALPDPADAATTPTVLGSMRALLLVSVKDEAAARTWLDATIAASAGATSTEAYGGTTLTLLGDGGEGAFALIDGKVAVVGDVASVRAAVDTHGAGGFGASPEIKAALDATSGDHVGFVYLATQALIDWSNQVGGTAVPGMGTDLYAGLIPDWIGMALRFEGDGLITELIAPTATGAPAVGETRASAVAEHVPANAIALTITNDYGKTIVSMLDAYRENPTLKSTIETLDKAMSTIGGPDKAIGWIGDAALVVGRTDTGLEAGLVITPTDKAAADGLFGGLKTILALGAGDSGVTVRDEAYAGTTITIIDLGSMGDLVKQTGLTSLPGGAGLLTESRIELAYAITDQVVVIGADPGFVRHVLDTTAATSIAQNDRYRALVGRVGQGSGIVFVDITAIRELVEPLLAAGGPGVIAEYEENVKPFLVPFDALIGSSTVQGDLNRSRVIITVK